MADGFQPKFVDLVRNTTTTTGTADFVLGPAATGYTGIGAALMAGDRFYYSAIGVDKPAEREVGRGTLVAGGTVRREPISGTRTDFTGGMKTIALVAAAEWFTSVQATAGTATFPTKAALALTSFRGGPALLTEQGCEGLFVFDASDLAARVDADRNSALTIPPATDLTGASGAWVRKASGAIDARWFGARGDGATDDTFALQAALDYVRDTGGGSLFLPAGTYPTSACLSIGARTRIAGSGPRSSVISCTHAGSAGATAGEGLRSGSALASAFPVNVPTIAEISLDNIGIACTNPASAGAGYYDTTGACIRISQCRFSGFKYGVVLDQSELVDIDVSTFEAQSDGGAGVWIVNGPDLNPAVQSQFTNRISVTRCQINEGLNTDGIVDDGGVAHAYVDNNYNGCRHHLYLAGSYGFSVRGGEFEGSATYPIHITALARDSGRGVGAASGEIIGGAIGTPANTAAVNVYSGGFLTISGSWMMTSPGTNPIRNEGGLLNLVVDNLQTSNGIEPINPSQTPPTYRNGGMSNQPAGYAIGAGGAVTQATSKSTGVTLNKLCGQITTSGSALTAGASASFIVSNGQVAATDTIELVLASGNSAAGSYNYQVDKVAAGSFAIWLKNISGGSLSEALAFNFTVRKAVAA